jgi:copper(I)-binding protein
MKKLVLSLFFILAPLARADIVVADAWVRSTSAGQSVAAVYLKITSDKPVKLIGASTKKASSVEIHEMTMDGDVMRMRKLPELSIPVNTTVELKPRGLHLMLMGVPKAIEVGSMVSMNLNFLLQDGQKKTLMIQASAKNPNIDKSTESQHKH